MAQLWPLAPELMTSNTNPVNEKKIVGSKWTATRPAQREKHFIVIDWERDDEGLPTNSIQLEAVFTHKIRLLPWRDLADQEQWRIGRALRR